MQTQFFPPGGRTITIPIQSTRNTLLNKKRFEESKRCLQVFQRFNHSRTAGRQQWRVPRLGVNIVFNDKANSIESSLDGTSSRVLGVHLKRSYRVLDRIRNDLVLGIYGILKSLLTRKVEVTRAFIFAVNRN